MTLSDYKKYFLQQLSGTYTETESTELFFIFCEELLNLDRFEVRKRLPDPLEEKQRGHLEAVLGPLRTGRPYQQILGHTVFHGLKFFVDEHVLVPRPETEELVELALGKLKEWTGMEDGSNRHHLKILDIGTGSGVIPIMLKKHVPEAEISAVDISEKALATARKNADVHGVNIRFIHEDYLNTALTDRYDVMISNPPYIGRDEEHEIADSVKEFEPKTALFSPVPDPLVFYRKIAADAEKHLQENGMVFLEINQKLGKETLALFAHFQNAELLQDLSGNDRFIFAVK